MNEKDGKCSGRGFDVRGLRDLLVLSKGGESLFFHLTMKKPTKASRRSTVHLDVAWQNPGVTNMTQSTVWVSGWGIEIPWVSTQCLYSKQQIRKLQFFLEIEFLFVRLGWKPKAALSWTLALGVVRLQR